MNLIILAAGIGRRLYPLTKDTPKSLLDLGDGSTLLDKQLESAAKHPKIDKVYVIAGYLCEQIETKIKQYQSEIDVEIIFNPFYDISNNLLSLWCAQSVMLEKDFLISNGDNIYKTNVYDAITQGDKDLIQLTIDYKDEYDEDDMKVTLSNGMVSQVSKKITVDQTNAESIGFVRVSGFNSRQKFHSTLLSMVKHLDKRDDFWLEIFNQLSFENYPVSALEINQHDWGEMDFHPDINAMRKAITSNIF